MSTKNKIYLKVIINILFFSIIIYFLQKKIDFHTLSNVLLEFNIKYIFIFYPLFFLFLFLVFMRFNEVLKIYFTNYKHTSILKIISNATILSSTLPAGIFIADVFKLISLRKIINKSSYKKLAVVIFTDRFMGLVALIFLSSISMLFTFDEKFFSPKFTFLQSFFNYSLFLFLFLLPLFIICLRKNLFNLFRFKILKKINFKIFFLSIIMQLILSFCLFLSFYIFGLEINFFIVLYMSGLIAILNLLPISIGVIGSRELGFILFFNFLNDLDREIVLVSSVFFGLSYILSVLFFNLLVYIYLYIQSKPMNSL